MAWSRYVTKLTHCNNSHVQSLISLIFPSPTLKSPVHIAFVFLLSYARNATCITTLKLPALTKKLALLVDSVEFRQLVIDDFTSPWRDGWCTKVRLASHLKAARKIVV